MRHIRILSACLFGTPKARERERERGAGAPAPRASPCAQAWCTRSRAWPSPGTSPSAATRPPGGSLQQRPHQPRLRRRTPGRVAACRPWRPASPEERRLRAPPRGEQGKRPRVCAAQAQGATERSRRAVTSRCGGTSAALPLPVRHGWRGGYRPSAQPPQPPHTRRRPLDPPPPRPQRPPTPHPGRPSTALGTGVCFPARPRSSPRAQHWGCSAPLLLRGE